MKSSAFLAAALLGLLTLTLHAQVPTITSFTAVPVDIHAGQSSALTWTVSGATSLSIDGGVGTVTGTSRAVSPAAPTTYTLTATNTSGKSTAAATVNVSPDKYIVAYDSALQGSWVRSCWEDTANPVFTDFAAAAPGRTSKAVEVRFGPNNNWNAFGIADRLPGWNNQYQYLNEMQTIEFDLYFEPDSTGEDTLSFILEDAGLSDEPNIVDYIPGWASMTAAQRYGHWFHIVVNLAKLNPTIPRFEQFLLFNGGTLQPHFRVADMKLGWLDDATAPVVTLGSATLDNTYDQLALAFTTSEAAIYEVDYGVGNFNNVLQGDSDDWSTAHTATLTGLSLGATVQYRVVASVHRTDPNATPNPGTYTGTYAVPSAPTTAAPITGFLVSSITGNRASLSWNTARPCTAVVTYNKTGGANMTRTFTDYTGARSLVLDLLEPSTPYTVTATTTDAFNLTATQSTTFTTGANGTPTVTITVNPASARAISPWIYGINFYDSIPNAPPNLTLSRAGGNRWTAYNWETNASNAGSDYLYENDNYLSSSTVPAEAVRSFIAGNRALGMASLVTVQLQGYVAGDESGPVDITDPNRFTTRFKQVVYQKGAAFTATPPTTDASVYMDEFLWALRGKFSGDIFSDTVAPTFISLDNEPELWPSTHAEIQSVAPPAEDYIQKTISLTSALKNLDPSVVLFGPVHYGFYGIATWQGDPTLTDPNYWFTDKYLDEMKAASTTAGKRLLDVYDFHWYSEAQADGTRIGDLTGTTLTPDQVDAIVQSPRSLWDTTYSESSWIVDYLGAPIYLLGRLQAKIDARWPGTKLSISEYENGGNNHIAGAIAQADNLGIFGQLGVFAATFWPTSSTYPYILAAFQMYRDYDGNLGSFGDTSLPTVSSATSEVAAYVSGDSTHAGRYVIVALNRSTASQDVNFTGLAASGTARVYRVDGTSATPAYVGQVPADLSTWIVTLPALTVSTIEITSATVPVSTSNITFDAATLSATVNPGGVATTVHFEYGLTTAYGTSTATQSIGAGTSNVPVSATLGALLPNTIYHYRIAITTSNGTTYGADQTLQTLSYAVVGNWAERTIVRTFPTTVGTEVDIGSLTFDGGTGLIEASINGTGTNWSVAKRYVIPIRNNLGNGSLPTTWLKVIPTQDTGPYGTNDFELDINVTGATAMLRLRLVSGTGSAGTARIALKTFGLNTLVNSTASAAVPAPTLTIAGNAVVEVRGKAGIGVTPTTGTVLEIHGANTSGLRLRTRSTIGAPATGTWSAGTMILDSAGNLYICASPGTPGTWRKVGN